MLVEACVDSVESAIAAQEGGAGRLELCAGLVEGGTTPSEGLIAVCRERITIPLFVIIRPRGGDFIYSEAELAVMRRDIVRAKQLGADGVVLGVLDRDGEVDTGGTRSLVELAQPMAATFHRAFDHTRDPDAALEAVIETGATRVLTSGHAETAVKGRAALARLVRQAERRLIVLAGGGITEDNVEQVVSASGVREVHVRGATQVPGVARYRNPAITFSKPELADEAVRTVADRDRIRRIVSRANPGSNAQV